jgi:hypothetical protein
MALPRGRVFEIVTFERATRGILARLRPRSKASLIAASFVAVSVAGAGCSGPPDVPAQPTWVDVAPILRGECAQCHGSTAAVTGFGYRLDFFDMTADVCGEAARAIPQPGLILGSAAASLIYDDVTPPGDGNAARMPPAPGPSLYAWERQTLQRWTVQPVKGPPPTDNHVPTIQMNGLPSTVNKQLTFTALLSDPDGDEVIGVIEVADQLFAMNRSGTFAANLDTSTWPAGPQRMTAILCDGWTSVSYDVGPVNVSH